MLYTLFSTTSSCTICVSSLQKGNVDNLNCEIIFGKYQASSLLPSIVCLSSTLLPSIVCLTNSLLPSIVCLASLLLLDRYGVDLDLKIKTILRKLLITIHVIKQYLQFFKVLSLGLTFYVNLKIVEINIIFY